MIYVGIIVMFGVVLMAPGIIVLKNIKKNDNEKSKEIINKIKNRSTPQKESHLPENADADFSGYFDHD